METKRNRRRGSALIMVLGILSVLLLMAVAFSSFVRTERSGSTNLKNAVVARSSLNTALGRVMDAIDLSFDSPEDDSPVAVWPHPWLASDGSVTNDYFQSSALGINETAGAHVLLSEMVPYLTPAQLALARAARCNWAPILGSVNASRARTSANGGLQGLSGRPTKDDLLGRYAFIVLDTTGLGSINMTGGGTAADRKTTTGGDTLSLCIPATTPQASDGTALHSFVKDPSAIDNARSFASLAQARAKEPGAFLSETNDTDRGKFPKSEGALFPADLFAGFSPSLDGLDPEGNPKIYLPSSAEFSSSDYKKGDAKNLLLRSLRAMVGVFARSRAAAGDDPKATSHDSIPIFQGSDKAAYSLPRSYLATVSLMDGLDDDDVPGRSSGKSLNYWDEILQTNQVVVKVAGVDVTEKKPECTDKKTLSSLDFPCTEPTLMLESVAAWIEFDSPRDPGTPDPALDPDSLNWERTYDATLHVVAKARSSNRTKGSRAHQATMEGQFFVMRGSPTSGTSGGDSRNIVEEDLEYFDEDAGMLCIDWDTFFAALDGEIQIDGNEATWNDSDEGAKCIIEYHSMPIEDAVRCRVRELGEENGVKTYDYYPICRAAHEGAKTDVFIPVCVQVTIKEGSRIKQQVPAPALERADPKEWWIRVNPGVYHGENSSFGGAHYEKDENGRWPTGEWKPSYGWAFCAVPSFAFDTTSLVAPAANQMNFWIGDEGAHPLDGGASSITGAAGGEFPDLDETFWSGPDPNDAAYTAALSLDTDQVGGGQNWIQVNWLVNEGDNYSHAVDDFLYAYTSQDDKTWKRHAPDFLHKARRKKAGSQDDAPPFIENNGVVSATRLIEELTTRFPSGGYESVGDLGTVMCGPLETLSLYKTWRHGSGKADFHPVIDYFTTARDRYPKPENYRDATNSDSGVVNWGKLSGDGSQIPYRDLYSAAHDGRVNLNAPPLVKCTKVKGDGAKKIGVRGDGSSLLNPLPIATVLNGAPYLSSENGTTTTNALKEEHAVRLARDLCLAIENADPNLDELWAEGRRWSTNSVVERAVVRHLSFLGGMDDDGVNTFLDHFIDYAKPQCDIAREGLIAGIVDGFTTRGQTYLAIIRADAYSPKFGENASVEDGTTLATTHAIVELFRDPLPARAPDGSLPADKKVDSGGEPVIYHNWYIRSFRVF